MIIDFLIELFTPMEGVDYALAPIVIAALTQVPGLIKGVSAANAAKNQALRDEQRAKDDQAMAKRALANLRAGKLEFEPLKDKLSDRYTDAFEMSMSRAPEQAAREAREQALASAIAAGGDPRTMGTNMLAATNMAQASRSDALAGLRGRTRAAETLAAQEQAISDVNTQRRQDQFDTELKGAQQLFTASRAQKRAAQDAFKEAQRAKDQAFTSALIGTATGALTMPGVNKAGDIFKNLPGALDSMNPSAASPQAINDILRGTQFEYGRPGQTTQQIIDNADLNDFGGIDDFDMPEEDFNMTQEFLDNLSGMARGGKVGKTGGVFDHETNKKALIDEESGEKEAELTGNETMFVFNPKQTSTFEKLVRGDDAKGLMKFMKQLLKKPQFNK